MGKRLIVQRRGTGSPVFRAAGHKRAAPVKYRKITKDEFENNAGISAEVLELFHEPGRGSPLAKVKFMDGYQTLMLPAEGVSVGSKIEFGVDAEIKEGNVLPLLAIPVRTPIFNIEVRKGDGGKLVKAGGSFATVVGHIKGMTKIMLPSKKEKLINSNCRAFLGEIGGGGRLEKPFLKAGTKFHEMKKKNKLYPKVSGVAMSAVDHPHGSTRSLRKGRPTVAPHNAPPGRKVGMLRPKHTGRNK